VLDPRLLTKAYGKTFLASLPPYPIVRDLGAARLVLQSARGRLTSDFRLYIVL
jgi:Rad3-related DNA helicase